MTKSTILFLGKQDDQHCLQALRFLAANASVESYLGQWGEPLPDAVRHWSGQYVVSYLSRWVIPEDVIARAEIAAINFHPASPSYPGIGCNNFALYENASEYGATCHFMASKVDTGAIIATKRFPIFPSDDVASLLSRTYAFQLVLFFEVAVRIVAGERLISSGETWKRAPFTRKEFNELSVIRPDMSANEVSRRIRATTFGRWKPSVEIGGQRFELADS